MDDVRVLQLVQQYLFEKGYTESLKTLQTESGTIFEEEELGQGGQLCAALYEYEDMKAALDGACSEEEARERRAAEEELLNLNPTAPYPSEIERSLDALHAANIIACRINVDGSLYATGGADRVIKIICGNTFKWVVSSVTHQWQSCDDGTDGRELRTIMIHAAPILALAWCPTDSKLLLSTSMDGKVFLSDATTGETLQSFSDHHKYVTRAAWSPGGDMFATCGREQAVVVYRRVADDEASGGGGGDDDAADRQPSDGGKPRFERLVRRDFTAVPEAICFLADNATLVVSVRDDNYLHYVSVLTGEDSKVNMNQAGDDHVSFTALDVVPSPNGKYLLVATDKSRLILYPVGMSTQLRNYYGATNDQDLKIFCWAVGSQRVIAQMKGHVGMVRDIDVSPDGGRLISAAFDKCLKIWRPAAASAL